VTLSPATVRRLDVMQLRVRLEQAAATAFDAACAAPADRTYRQSNTTDRLLFLLARVSEDRQAEVHPTVRLARHVYERTSDVLHGRLDGLSVPPAVIQEWSTVVDAVEALVRQEDT
jgi:hypothetical protein